ncbi:MAG TPA: hypothetical protein VIS76_16655 [Pseudomonadales bacterium]
MDLADVCRDRRFYAAVAAVRNYAYDSAAWLRLTTEAFQSLLEVIERSDAVASAEGAQA